MDRCGEVYGLAADFFAEDESRSMKTVGMIDHLIWRCWGTAAACILGVD